MATASFDTHIVWSANDVFGDADDVIVSGSVAPFTGLAAGAEETKTLSLQLDKAALYANAGTSDAPGQPVGTVSRDTSRLFLVVDVNNDIIESDESNNFGQGHLIDSDDITYFAWDKDGNGTVTPLEALSSIQAINTANSEADLDGNGIVTPLEALSVVQRIGYVRNDNVIGDAPASANTLGPVPSGHASESSFGLSEPALPDIENAAFPVFANPTDDEEEGALFLVEPISESVLIPGTSDDASANNGEAFVTTQWLDVI